MESLRKSESDTNSFEVVSESIGYGNEVDEADVEIKPSITSIKNAGEILSECNSQNKDIQNEMAKLLEEKLILQETLVGNNKSIKEQYETLQNMQKDMVAAFDLQKNKIAEAKEQIKQLETENGQLKGELEKLKSDPTPEEGPNNKNICIISNNIEIEDTIDKLSQQLALVEKERRTALEENHKLKWQNDSFKTLVLNHDSEIKLKSLEYDNMKKQCNDEIQMKEAEIQEWKNKLKDTYKIILQPVTSYITVEDVCEPENFSKFVNNLKEYNKNVKEMAKVLNNFLNDHSTFIESSTNLVHKIHRHVPIKHVELMNTDFDAVKNLSNNHQANVGARIHTLKETLACIEKIFTDYQTVLKTVNDMFSNKSNNIKEQKVVESDLRAELLLCGENIEAKEKEISNLQKIVETLQKEADQVVILNLQLESYTNDFNLERQARTTMANEKVDLMNQLRNLQELNQKLLTEKNNQAVVKQNTTSESNSGASHANNRDSPNMDDMEIIETPTTYCPLCDLGFKNAQKLQDHVYLCLDQQT